MFGYPADEAIGESLDLIIPEGLRARHWDGYRQTMATGVTRYADDLLAVPGRRRDGNRISLEFRVAILADRDGRPEAIAAVLRDVTARRAEDRALREELARLQAAATPTKASGPERRPRDPGGSSQADSRRPAPEVTPRHFGGPRGRTGRRPGLLGRAALPRLRGGTGRRSAPPGVPGRLRARRPLLGMTVTGAQLCPGVAPLEQHGGGVGVAGRSTCRPGRQVLECVHLDRPLAD